jgi:hypothetical protein
VEDFRDRPVTRLRQYLKFKNARPLCQGKAFCALAIKLPELPDQLSPCIPERATSLHFPDLRIVKTLLNGEVLTAV